MIYETSLIPCINSNKVTELSLAVLICCYSLYATLIKVNAKLITCAFISHYYYDFNILIDKRNVCELYKSS